MRETCPLQSLRMYSLNDFQSDVSEGFVAILMCHAGSSVLTDAFPEWDMWAEGEESVLRKQKVYGKKICPFATNLKQSI